jgi:hypothetical protein
MAELDNVLNEPNESEARINQLSKKVSLTVEERDAAKAAQEAAEAKVAETTRERDFYQGFADVVSTNPAAKDHKDEILEKVKGGYSVEDATMVVLGKAGKLAQQAAPAPQQFQQQTGGSAPITPPSNGVTKSPGEMTQAERREALLEAERRGDIALS